jgi:polyisoprenoid-binding protein YceI
VTSDAEGIRAYRIQPPFPDGTWTVDRQRSEIGFVVKGMWGLATVRGTFDAYQGTVTCHDGELSGALEIDAASLDTGHTKRDRHLRSEDFFDVERHPQITFAATGLDTGDEGPIATGELAVASARIPLRIPVSLTHDSDAMLRLTATTSIERAAAGMTWNWLGTIRGPAKLNIELALRREAGT